MCSSCKGRETWQVLNYTFNKEPNRSVLLAKVRVRGMIVSLSFFKKIQIVVITRLLKATSLNEFDVKQVDDNSTVPSLKALSVTFLI